MQHLGEKSGSRWSVPPSLVCSRERWTLVCSRERWTLICLNICLIQSIIFLIRLVISSYGWQGFACDYCHLMGNDGMLLITWTFRTAGTLLTWDIELTIHLMAATMPSTLIDWLGSFSSRISMVLAVRCPCFGYRINSWLLPTPGDRRWRAMKLSDGRWHFWSF